MGMYLDYNASTPVDPRVLDVMVDVYRNHFGNASSRTHKFGSDASKIVEQARENVASLLGVQKNEVIFTSGSTESNNMAVLGLEEKGQKSGKMHIITTAMEHKSVLEPCKILEKRGFEVEYLKPGEDGRIQAEDVWNRLRDDTLLVSVMHVNNETGTIQPVRKIGEFLRERSVLFHVDVSQSCGKLVDEIREIPFDILSASAHKMGGPQGVGILVARNKRDIFSGLQPITYGGGQEWGMRPGTLPVALIAGLGKAAEISWKEKKEIHDGCQNNLNAFLRVLEESGVKYQINGDLVYSAGSCLNVSFEDYDSEALMLMIQEIMGAAISNGSACTSQSDSYQASYVLQAMGLEKKRIESAVRISWGREKIDEEIFYGITEIVKSWQKNKI